MAGFNPTTRIVRVRIRHAVIECKTVPHTDVRLLIAGEEGV